MVKSKAQRELETIVNKIATLEVRAGDNQDARDQLQKLQLQVDELRTQIRSHQQYGAWARTELARHSDRPYTLDYVERIFTDWTELHGDRNFGDDPALICGIARFNGEEVMVIGHQKGRDIKSRVYRNFGQPNPEGYRKALRFMQMAEKFNRPLFTFVDTPGAYPGSWRRRARPSRSYRPQSSRDGPTESSDHHHHHRRRWLRRRARDRSRRPRAHAREQCVLGDHPGRLRLHHVARRQQARSRRASTEGHRGGHDRIRRVDEVIPEPAGGAHHDYDATAANLSAVLQKHLSELRSEPAEGLTDRRYNKFRKMAQFFEEA